MLVNREVILVKIEDTYNTDAVSTAADNAVYVMTPSWSNSGLRMNERSNVKSSIAADQHIYGGALKQITFEVEIKGSGTAGTAPECGALLRACGFDETIVASTSVTYAPVSTAHESVTIYYYQDGVRHIMTGCRGNASFSLEVGGIGKISFTMTGHASPLTDEDMVSPTYDSTVPRPIIGASFSVGGYHAVIASLSFDMSNTIATPPDMNSSDGFSAVYITKRDVNGSFNPEMTLVATKDFLGDLTSGTTMALTTGTIGDTAGNQFAVDMPLIYARDIAPGERDGTRIIDYTFGAVESSGDDEVSITFT
jgi:hypothetical protein